MPIFRAVVAKRCLTTSCRKDKRPVHEGFCEECGKSLGEVWGLDRWRMGLLACGLAVVGVGAALIPKLLETASRPRPAPTRAEVGEPPRSQGYEVAAQDRHDEARVALQREVDRQAADATAWANLGVAYAIKNHSDEALRCYRKALQLDPGHWLAHYNLGLLWGRRGDRERALAHLTRAFAGPLDPDRRRDLVRDLRTAAVPASLRQDPRFAALLAESERKTGR